MKQQGPTRMDAIVKGKTSPREEQALPQFSGAAALSKEGEMEKREKTDECVRTGTF